MYLVYSTCIFLTSNGVILTEILLFTNVLAITERSNRCPDPHRCSLRSVRLLLMGGVSFPWIGQTQECPDGPGTQMWRVRHSSLIHCCDML